MEEQEIEALGLDGFRSGVWADGARMEALVGSADAWKTSQAAYYLLLWCRENGVDPSEQLDVGDEIFVPHADYGDIPCILIGKGIDGTGSLTFITREIVCQRCFDAPEPTNPNASRRNSGSSRYSQSNILQWLNSAKPAGGQWYKAQHEYDAPPDGTNVSVNAYDTEAGFLCGFDLHFLNALQPVS